MLIRLPSGKFLNVFTLLLTITWIASLVVRFITPAFSQQAGSIDAGMLMVIGYWFSANAVRSTTKPGEIDVRVEPRPESVKQDQEKGVAP